MPFISEQIWFLIADRDLSISITNVPEKNQNMISSKIEDDFELLQSLIEEIRKMRSSANLPPSKKLPLYLNCKDENAVEFLNSQKFVIELLARCSESNIGVGVAKPEPAVTGVIKENEIYLAIGDLIDLDAERLRLSKEIERLNSLIISSEKKLSNEKFVSNASPDIVKNEREKLSNFKNSLDVVTKNLTNLG
jgi:valyl-tRNA synthetase